MYLCSISDQNKLNWTEFFPATRKRHHYLADCAQRLLAFAPGPRMCSCMRHVATDVWLIMPNSPSICQAYLSRVITGQPNLATSWRETAAGVSGSPEDQRRWEEVKRQRCAWTWPHLDDNTSWTARVCVFLCVCLCVRRKTRFILFKAINAPQQSATMSESNRH